MTTKKTIPLLNSEKAEFLRKIRQLQEDTELTQTATLQKVTRIINEADYIDEEIKTKILKEIWK